LKNVLFRCPVPFATLVEFDSLECCSLLVMFVQKQVFLCL